MANYSIQRSDLATGNLTVTEASTNTATNATLIGQNFTGYGDEIATNFLQMLENFASDVDPTTNPRVVGSAIRGQLWYDTTVGTGTLRVHDGTGFVDIAKINSGSTESSTLRWNDTNGRYQPEERVRISDGGALIIDAAAAGTNAVTITHTAGDLEIAGAGTTNINVTGVTAVTMPSLQLTTVLDEIYGGTGVITYAQGDILYASGADTLVALNAGTNGQVLTMGATVPSWVSTGAGVTTLTTLTDVDTSGVITGSLMYKTGTDWTDTPGLTWNVIAGNLSATRFGNILEGNLLDKAQNSEVITGTNWDFAGLSVSSGQLAATTGTTLRILSDNNTDWVDFSHGSGVNDGNFDIVGNATVDLNITGFTGFLNYAGTIKSGGSTGIGLKVLGDDNNFSDSNALIEFRDSTESDLGMYVGSFVGSNNSLVNARLGFLELHANNLLAMTLRSTGSTIHVSGGIEAMEFRNPSSVAGATTSASVGDYTSNAQRNVGWNETPTADHVLENINTGSRIIDEKFIGKMISRTTGTSRSVTINVDANIPVGASVLVHNGASGGTLTIVNGTITNLDWIDGSGAIPTRTSNRTLAYNSICTLRKVNESTWQIWGNGIT